MRKEWFEIWFNTKYHDLLYQHRIDEDITPFLLQLIKQIKLESNAFILDVGCGKGRHSIQLAKMGFDVTGIDLSFPNIQEAHSYENEKLSFFRHDMRNKFCVNYFDCVVNFFTSFGYFHSDQDDMNSLNMMATALKLGGHLVIDYLNPDFVLQHLIEDESRKIEIYDFKITKEFIAPFIIKNIEVYEHNKFVVSYFEKVKSIRLHQFEKYFEMCGLELMQVFGNYHFQPYSENHSERMILIVKKNSCCFLSA